jgi:hypothetical protein
MSIEKTEWQNTKPQETDSKPVEFLDLNSFTESKELVAPLLAKKVILSLTTATFSELECYYRARRAGSLPPGSKKPIFGQVLEFKDFEHFIAGITSGYYPEGFVWNYEYTGMAVHPNGLFVCNGNHLEKFKNGEMYKIKNKLFNDLHAIDFSADGKRMLVCSTGIDRLLEFSYPGMDLIWSWSAPEYGYTKAPDGTLVLTEAMLASIKTPTARIRIIDQKGVDYSVKPIETPSQAAHIDSAKYLDDEGNIIGATIFHGGDAILINRGNKTTSKIMSGVEKPHGLFRFGTNNEFNVVTETPKGLVDIFDKNFNKIYQLQAEIKRLGVSDTWIQNTFPVGGDVLASVDHCNRRVVFFNILTKKRFIVETPNEWKIFQLSITDNLQNYLTS